MRRKGPRLLTPEEASLWEKVTRRTASLHPDRLEPTSTTNSRPELERNVSAKPVRSPIQEFRVGEKGGSGSPSYDLAPSVSQYLQSRPLRMDKRTHDRLKRGKIVPAARIDLHGMTAAEALPELNRFILKANAAGLRLVLVITGKGRNSTGDGLAPVREGVLKRQVPRWLVSPPLSQLVLDISEAHPRHGGSGAYYVYLRRRI